MENRIHQIMQLDDGKKYVVFKQAIYKGENYFVAAELDEYEQPLDQFKFFREVIENGDTYAEAVQDESMIQLLIQYLKLDKE